MLDNSSGYRSILVVNSRSVIARNPDVPISIRDADDNRQNRDDLAPIKSGLRFARNDKLSSTKLERCPPRFSVDF